jgi:general secretion pathway protein B
MSFILDALKKSEAERQRQTVPGLMDTRLSDGRRRLPLWAIALSVLLGINLIVLTVVLTRGGSKAMPATVSSRIESRPLHPIDRSPPADTAASVADHFSPLDSTPEYAPEIPVPADSKPGVAAAIPPRTGGIRSIRRPDPVLIDEDAQADNQEVLPSINEINLTGAQALPELHLDVHVYATKAADRFVYINMRKYHEGATLQEGPILERIRRDGVVLNSQGVRFILPRQP